VGWDGPAAPSPLAQSLWLAVALGQGIGRALLALTAALMASRSAPRNLASAGAEVARLRLRILERSEAFPLSLRGGKPTELTTRKGSRSVSQVESFEPVLVLRSPCTSRDSRSGPSKWQPFECRSERVELFYLSFSSRRRLLAAGGSVVVRAMLALAAASTAFGHQKRQPIHRLDRSSSTGPPTGAVRIDRVEPSTSPIPPGGWGWEASLIAHV
jgi:hypothetical protein